MREHKNKPNPNSIYIPHDLLENIFLRLPLKPLLQFKTVSKEWKSILESKSFVDMRMSFQKSGKTCRKILVAYHCDYGPPNIRSESRFVWGEEFVYLNCHTKRPSMRCDGLVCIPEPGWVNVLNLATRQHLRFPSGPDPVSTLECPRHKFFISVNTGLSFRDTGRWDSVETKKLSPPPYQVDVGRRSAYVNGKIYWFENGARCQILALDLHTEEFHDVSLPHGYLFNMETEIMSVEDRLSTVTGGLLSDDDDDWTVEIWSLDAEEKRWSKTYLISLNSLGLKPYETWWFTHVTVSGEGDVVFYEGRRSRLYKHNPLTNTVRQIYPGICNIIYPYYPENLVWFQTDARTQSAYFKVKNAIASALGIPLGVDKFICQGKEWLWYNQMKMLVAYLFVHLLWSFCTGDTLSLPMLVWLDTLELRDIIKFMVMVLVFRLVVILSSLLIFRVFILVATGALTHRLFFSI
ncbi:unnamed protein product [Microthlaspi erraticum]|uniref:F-box domain-containing protein n=1 Tax=Microthlaspi erraticum TaxID=1685480 RepID=A0A6D2K0G0_9BRAS|nr:unnamed protein product [Microthlaspi erraticum]